MQLCSYRSSLPNAERSAFTAQRDVCVQRSLCVTRFMAPKSETDCPPQDTARLGPAELQRAGTTTRVAVNRQALAKVLRVFLWLL